MQSSELLPTLAEAPRSPSFHRFVDLHKLRSFSRHGIPASIRGVRGSSKLLRTLPTLLHEQEVWLYLLGVLSPDRSTFLPPPLHARLTPFQPTKSPPSAASTARTRPWTNPPPSPTASVSNARATTSADSSPSLAGADPFLLPPSDSQSTKQYRRHRSRSSNRRN